MSDFLIITREAGWARLTLNRPEARNALNTAVLGRLASELGALDSDPDCRAVVIHGANGHFAAGADISEIETKTKAEAAADPRKDHWAGIRGFSKPLIAAVDGFCLGGGFELALMADLIVAGATAKFGLPETNLGIIPGAGGAQRLLALVGRARASRMVLTGEIIDADTAFAYGIAAYKADTEALPLAKDVAAKLAARAPLALRAAKAALVKGDEAHLDLAGERAAFEALVDSADKAEGIAAFRQKRAANFKGE